MPVMTVVCNPFLEETLMALYWRLIQHRREEMFLGLDATNLKLSQHVYTHKQQMCDYARADISSGGSHSIPPPLIQELEAEQGKVEERLELPLEGHMLWALVGRVVLAYLLMADLSVWATM